MSEKIEYKYDLKFVVATAVRMFVEKQLYDSKSLLFPFNNRQYIRAEVKKGYWDARPNCESFDEQCMALLVKRYPQGANLDEKIFNEIANDVLTKITDKLSFVTAYSKVDDDTNMNSCVECGVLRHKILCRFLDHYRAVLDLIFEFFGKNQILKGIFTDGEIADFVQNNLTISSAYTDKASICKDIRSFGVSKLLMAVES